MENRITNNHGVDQIIINDQIQVELETEKI